MTRAIGAFLGLAALALWALTVGAEPLALSRVLAALVHGGEARADLLVLTVRLPRVLAALAVGAALAVSGRILQAVTRNPLADPGLLGISAGAACAVVLGLALWPGAGRAAQVAAAFGGALAAAVLVQGLGAAGRRGATPLRLVLAGVVVGSFLGALTTALLIFDTATLDAVRIWTAGSLAGQRMGQVLGVSPWLAAALLAALATQRQVAALAMGPEVAQALGLDPRAWWAAAVSIAAALAAGAVALAGPVGFVGLVVPHALRLATGGRAGPGLTLLAGAAAVLLADTLPRALLGRDIPVGVTLAVLGAPVLVALAVRMQGRVA